MAENSAYNSFISKPEISFWVPIITTCVLLALSYGALLARISLIEQKQDTQIKLTQDLLDQNKTQISGILGRLGNLALQVNTLETRANLK